MDSSTVRQFPSAIQAEQALLGAIIIDSEAFDKVAGIIKPEDFYLEEHKHIYNAILKMYSASRTIDTVTLVNAIVEFGNRDQAGGIQYVSMLAEAVPSVSNVKDYAQIVKDKSTLRRLIVDCESIIEDAYNETDVKMLVDSAEQKVFDISHKNNESKDFRHIRDVLQNVYRDIEKLSETGGAVTGSKTGFSDLDKMLVQMGKGDLIILGARPGMGKTSFALNIATNVAKQSGKAVAIFSLEMSAEQLVTRIVSSEAMIDSHSLRTGELSGDDWDNIADVISELSGCDIYIDDTSAITSTDMKSKLRRLQNLGFVVIDYIGLMQTTIKTDNRAQQVGEISRNLKIMAKDFGIPILCCAQLNRGTESRQGASKKPTLADLRDSGSIEQDADIVLFLYRDEYYDTENANDEGSIAEVIVAKNRHGSQGTVKMGWIGRYTKFRTIATNMEEG